jgi:hypothetical protein
LLDGLHEQITRPDAVEYVLDNFEGQLLKALDNLGGELDRMHRRRKELERKIGEIAAKLLEARPDSLRVRLRNIRSFVELHMRDIPAIVNSDVVQTRAIFAKHIEKITLTPTGEHYVASGTWDIVGRGSIGGARIAHNGLEIEFRVEIAA